MTGIRPTGLQVLAAPGARTVFVSRICQSRIKASAGIVAAKLTVRVLDHDAEPTRLVSRLGEEQAETELRAIAPAGSGIAIKLEDVDHGPLRSCWNKNVLEIAARHPLLKRYLGPTAERYPGQDALHSRVLLAELLAEALCARRLEGNIESNPDDFEGTKWDDYYGNFALLVSRILPMAHRLMPRRFDRCGKGTKGKLGFAVIVVPRHKIEWTGIWTRGRPNLVVRRRTTAN